jgi:hypothetical protein
MDQLGLINYSRGVLRTSIIWFIITIRTLPYNTPVCDSRCDMPKLYVLDLNKANLTSTHQASCSILHGLHISLCAVVINKEDIGNGVKN